MLAPESTAERLAESVVLLERTATFFAAFAERWLIPQSSSPQLRAINKERTAILQELAALPPRPPSRQDSGLESDPVHALLSSVVDNLPPRLAGTANCVAVAAFAQDIAEKQTPATEREPWHLVGLDAPPPALASIRRTAANLSDILAEIAFDASARHGVNRSARRGKPGSRLKRARDFARKRAAQRHQAQLAQLKAACRCLNISMSDFCVPSTASWPRWRTALTIQLQGLTALASTFEALSPLLDEIADQRYQVDVLPMREGKIVTALAATYSTSGGFRTDPAVAASWAELGIPFLSTPLSDAVSAAHSSLRELSSLNYLMQRCGQSDAIEAAVQETVAHLEDAIETIADLPQDPVLDELLDVFRDIAARVQAEANEERTERSFADAVALGIMEGSGELDLVNGSTLVALEWDISPAGALEILEASSTAS